jgi:hypothetical protein
MANIYVYINLKLDLGENYTMALSCNSWFLNGGDFMLSYAYILWLYDYMMMYLLENITGAIIYPSFRMIYKIFHSF